MPAESKLSPYNLTQAVDLRFIEVVDTVDETIELRFQDAGEDNNGMRRVDVRGKHWHGLVMTIEASLDTSKLDEVLAEGASDLSETRMILSLRCPRTKLRRPVVLKPDEKKAGVWGGDVMIQRRDAKSRVELHPLLYRLTEIPSSESMAGAKAQHRFALLATGQAVTVSIDDVERLPSGPIKIKWQDSADGKNPWLYDNRQTLYYFEYDDEEPILWLNSRNKNLRGLLFEKTEDTVDSALRRLLSTWLAETVWLQLFHTAVASLAADAEEESGVLPEGWRGNVLQKFLLQMFPEQEIEVALDTVIEAKTSPDQFGALMGKASTVVQSIVASHKNFSEAVRAAEPAATEKTVST